MIKDILKNQPQTEDDVEIQKLMDQIQDCYDKIMLITLHKMYGVKAELVGDDKISIDGQVMDEEEFTDWLYDKEVELGHIQEPEREYDA